MPAVEIRALSVSYRDADPAVAALDLSVAPGAWTGIVGPNGAGKSTVLRTVTGLVAYRGSVRVGGTEVASMRPRDRARRVALVPQRAVAPAGMTVESYVLLGRTPHVATFATESRADRDASADAIEDLGMARFRTRVLGSLSGGELQRAILARAFAQRAPLLLLDEPTTFLDVGRQQEALELVDALRLRDGITVMSVMHDLTLASQFADELVLLSGGVAVATGPATRVLTERSIRDHYGATVRIVHDAGRVAVLPSRGPFPETPPTERPRRDVARARPGSLVLVNTGDGKGKTTAAIGVVVRAVAREWPVCVVQFLKSGKWRPGEEEVARRVGVEWHAMGDGFTWDSEDMEQTKALAVAAWETAKQAIASGAYRLVVLDEVTYPITWGWVDVQDALAALRTRPDHVNVVLTGRDAPAELVEVADTVTEMRNVKHAFDAGVNAVRGIDF